MAVDYLYPDYEVVRNPERCIACRVCERQCANEAHTFDAELNNANWTGETIKELYRQAGTGGVLLSSMGNPKPYPVYWDRLLINASQVTNPSIDPLREPMETRAYLGKKPEHILRDQKRGDHMQSGAAASA